MHALAEMLNKELEITPVFSMLSDFGKRIYAPHGNNLQTAQAYSKPRKYNASMGVSTENGILLHMEETASFFNNLTVDEMFTYTPAAGNPALRKKWQELIRTKNPDIGDALISMPVTSVGLTNGVFTAMSLFCGEGDSVVMPSLYWENYDLIIEEHSQAQEVKYEMFAEGKFNLKGFENAVNSVKSEKVIVLLNFPNNPTGYSPTVTEAENIALILKKAAESGKKIVAVCDDAYFGFFFDSDVYPQSMFAKLCNLHGNILAVKCDGCTKEDFVWGFRLGFITYGSKNLAQKALDALVEKTIGVMRATLSSCSTPLQNILLKAMSQPDYEAHRREKMEKVRCRAVAMKKALGKYRDVDIIRPIPFNSGYFMSFETKCDAEKLRLLLLDNYSTATICINPGILRVAYSSVDEKDIQGLVDTIYSAVR